MSFANDILDAIEIMVKQVVEDNTTKIYTGVCKTIGVNSCVLTINGKDNTVKYYGGVPTVGTVYQVFIPFGNMSAAFIIVPGSGGGSGGGSGSSGVNSVNGKTGDVVLNAADIGALPNTTTIPSKTSQLTNDSGYITESSAPVKSVDGETGAVVTNAIKTTQQNLTDAQKTQARINIGAGTSSFDGNYSSLSGKPTIPSNTSQLNNDSGFITSESAPVKSVNSKTGDVMLSASDVEALPTSGGTLTGDLTVGSARIKTNGYVVGTWLQGTATNHLTNAATKIAVQDGSGWVYHRTAEEIKSDIGLSNVDNVKQYSASNPPPYPVVSVNGKTGGVNLVASDVGAVSTDNITQTLGTSTTKVPSEKAVSDALSGAGAGDMLKAIYDPNGSVATAGGIPNYVEANGGKIDTIKVNGATQPITNKEVDITVPTNNNQLTNGAGYIIASEAPVTSVNGQTGDVTVSAELPEHLVKYDTLAPIETTTPINADTLQGHAANYFATKTDVSALSAVVDSNTDDITANTQNISTNTQNIATLQSNISTLQSSVNGKVSKSGDTMTGALIAQNNTNYSVAQVRNIIISTSNPSGGNSGDIWIRYVE